MSPPAIRDWFVADHLRLESLLEQALRELESNEHGLSHVLWSAFIEKLAIHIDVEERYLMPALDEHTARVARTLHEEHRYLRARSHRLAEAIGAGHARPDEIHAFADELRAHASHEDRMLYSWADHHMPPAAHLEVLTQLQDGGVLKK